MRPGQNKRMRGRNNNNGGRKGPNPLTRSYESNGPDVKIRGTAQHIGEKYLQLARDAQTSGDPVAAESYLQHAEHYFRLIAAAQQAQYQAQAGYVRQGDTDADAEEDDDDLSVPDRFASPAERLPPPPVAPQPQALQERGNGYNGERPQGQGYERPNGQNFGERQERPDRQERFEGQDRPYRQERFGNDRDHRNAQDRHGSQGGERSDRNFDRGGRNDRNDRNRNRFNGPGQDHRDNRDARDMQFRDQPRIAPAPRETFADQRPQPTPVPAEPGPDLPAFITAPVRTVPPLPEPELDLAPTSNPPEASAGAPDEDAMVPRPRRRRRARMIPVNGESPDVPDSAPSGD